MTRVKNMSSTKSHGLKLVEMPKQVAPPPVPRSPFQDTLAQVYAHSAHLKNLVVVAHYDDNSSQVLSNVQAELDTWTFVDAMRLRATQATVDFLMPPEPPTKQIS
jgi:hypothetical protein